MINYIWAGLIIISYIVAAFTGRIEATTTAAMDSATGTIQMVIGLLGIMCLWMGLMKIAEKSGMMKVVAKMFRPVTRFLFPEIPQNSPAMRAIVSNITANFLGLGNAATPMGLTAMREMDKINSYREKASNSMCTFAVLNSASLQLIPATVIAIRQSAGSSNPFEIIACVWVCSVCTVIVAVGSAKIMSLKKDKIRV